MPSRNAWAWVLLLVAVTAVLSATSAAAAEPATSTVQAGTPDTAHPPSAPQARVSAADCLGPDVICTAGEVVANAPELVGLADDVAGAAAGSGLESLASSTFGGIAQTFGEAGISFLASLADAFVESSTVELSAAGIDPILAIATPIAMLVAVVLIVAAAGRAAVSGQGSVIATALVGIVKAVLVTALIVTVAQTALYASDELSRWIIDRSLGGNKELEQRLGALITLSALSGSSALVLVFGLLAIVVCLILWVELLFRAVAIVVLVAMAPIAAAGQVLGETSEWWAKARNALIQLILLKPVIALCFAVGFSTFGSATDLTGVIAGFVTLGLAAFAWPLLARFMTFTAAGAAHGLVSGLLGATAGLLAGVRMGGPSSGPAAATGTGYTLALERENDAAATSAGSGSAGQGISGSGAAKSLASRSGGTATTGALAVVGAAATAGSAVLDHVEAQMSGAAADSGIGHATRSHGTHGHTRGRFRNPGRHTAGPASGADNSQPPPYEYAGRRRSQVADAGPGDAGGDASAYEPGAAPAPHDAQTQEGTVDE